MISIIVPIYNVEKYLPEAIASIRNQTFRDFEVILVDDGSTDGSGQICDDVAATDFRFRVLHQENGGVSAARNTGLKAARGQYIAWIDPDDTAEKNMLELLYEKATDTGAEIVISCYDNLLDIPLAGNELATSEYLRRLLTEKSVHSYLWDKLFKKEIFEGIEFEKGMRYEDVRIMHRLFRSTSQIATIPQRVYNYTIRDDSITGSTNREKCAEFIAALEARVADLAGSAYERDAIYGYYAHIRRLVYEIKRYSPDKSFTKELCQKAREAYKQIKPYLGKKEKLFSGIFNFSPGLYTFCRKILDK